MKGGKDKRPIGTTNTMNEYDIQCLENLEKNAKVMEARGVGIIANKILDRKKKFMELGSNVDEVQHDCFSKKGVKKVVVSSNETEAEVIVQEEQIACSSKSRKRKPRGPSKGVQSKIGDPMILEYDALLRPTGKWAKQYPRHCGACASRTNINTGGYYDLLEVELYKNWDEAKRLFNIEELFLKKKEVNFHAKVTTHFRAWKTKLRRRWLMKKKSTKSGG